MAKQTRAKRKSGGSPRKKTVAKPANKPAVAKNPQPQSRPPLRPAWQIGWQAMTHLWRYRNFFGLLVVVYLLLDLLLVRSVAVFDVSALKSGLSSSLSHGAGMAVGGLSVFSSLFSSAVGGASTDATGAYHFFLVVLMSLAVIWSLRQVFASGGPDQPLHIRSAFYQSTTPLVPFLLIVLLIGAQLIPLLLTMYLYSYIVGGGITSTAVQQLVFLVLLIGVALLSLLWLIRSIIALYIVTLPGVRPMQAYQSAKDLVNGRRLSLARKLLFLPVALFVLAAIVMVPVIIIWAPLAQWLFFVLTGVGFVLTHAYLYAVYRELLRE